MAEGISAEIAEIELNLARYADLLARVRQRPPDHVELAALALVLHTFYMGLENIFAFIAKQLDGAISGSSQWHHALLARMRQPTQQRTRVISEQVAKRLMPYLQFRHVVRHAYLADLEWAEMSEGVMQLPDVWAQTKAELVQFIETLQGD